MIKNVALFLSMIFFMLSCSKEKQVAPKYVRDVNVRINILNNKGEDLLNPEISDYFPFDSMKLYYLVNGKKTEVFDTLMDSPRNMALIKETKPYTLEISTYVPDTIKEGGTKRGTSIAYLQLSSSVIDTIKTEWEATDSYFINTKIWYNGVLKDRFKVIKLTKSVGN